MKIGKIKHTNTVDSARRAISDRGNNEILIKKDNPTMEEIFDQIQNLRVEMNQAKAKAAEEAARPYLEQIKALEEDYAMILRLSSN